MSFEIILLNEMKHSSNDDGGVLQTNLLQAFQKNKLIQGQLNEQHRIYYVKLIREMQDLKLKEKLNKELLYTWKKENYVRQLKKKLQEYERKRFGVRDAYYEYQARNLDCVITGQQGLVIPPEEEQRRLNVNAKLTQFLEENPLRTVPLVRLVQQRKTPTDEQFKKKKEEEDAHAVQETWKHIHAQSAYGLKKKPAHTFPSIQRSLTMDEIKRNKTIINEEIKSSADVKDQTHLPNVTSKVLDDFQPVSLTSEALEKETHGDLVTMRSVRRPQKNPIDLNMVFESRKRIYQINKRVYHHHLCPRKCGLQFNTQFDRPEQINPIDDDENLLVEMSETTRQRYEDRHQADKNFV